MSVFSSVSELFEGLGLLAYQIESPTVSAGDLIGFG